MISIQTGKSGSKRTFQFNNIHDIPKDNKALSSYILLKSSLKAKDRDFIQHKRVIKILEGRGSGIYRKMKLEVFAKISVYYGSLTCAICKRNDLIIPNKENIKQKKLDDNHATIEHIKAISKGGHRYSIRNMTCTCNKCNSDRSDLPLFKLGEHSYAY